MTERLGDKVKGENGIRKNERKTVVFERSENNILGEQYRISNSK
jgi:hypothetical protein